MSDFNNLKSLGDGIRIQIPTDEHGLIGRECPVSECEGYFKIKLGTGLKGPNLPCYCPYCGHESSQDHFWTKEQIEYAKSIAISKISDALVKDFKKYEFEVKPSGPFGIGISMKFQPGPQAPIRYYREKSLETNITCDSCGLEYSVYGVFAYCPDCGNHNSLQILNKNLDLMKRQMALAELQQDIEFKRYLMEDALENCVSAFDAFARQSCRLCANKSTDPEKAISISFQNLNRANSKLKTLFGIDLHRNVSDSDWKMINLQFQRRHLISHRAGVVDADYLSETGENGNLLGKRISINKDETIFLSDILKNVSKILVELLSK